jgi:hypothetical protein
MSGRKSDNLRTEPAEPESGRRWPPWTRRVVSVALLFHLAAVLTGALGAVPPFSDLEQAAYMAFKPYYDLIDQGYAYNYYAPEPPPTPVVEATLHFADGRPDATIRIPDRGIWPRLRYQRQLALAHYLHDDFEMARGITGDGGKSRWAHSYARHLCGTHPGCRGVTLQVRMHKIPELPRIHEIWESSRRARVDLDAEEFYGEPERIGEYPCAD